MKIRALGSGNMASVKYLNSMFLLEFENTNLLFDAGFDLKHALDKSNLKPSNIENVFISHPHSDHIGGLEYLGFMTFFSKDGNKPNLIANRSILDDIWERSLSNGMESIENKYLSVNEINATLSTYFNPKSVQHESFFELGKIKFYPVRTKHIVNGENLMNTFGLRLTSPKGTKIFFTADMQFLPDEMQDIYENMDIIVHDCETEPTKSFVHSHYEDLLTLPGYIRKKLYLVHFSDNVNDHWIKRALSDGFKGFLMPGTEIEV